MFTGPLTFFYRGIEMDASRIRRVGSARVQNFRISVVCCLREGAGQIVHRKRLSAWRQRQHSKLQQFGEDDFSPRVMPQVFWRANASF